MNVSFLASPNTPAYWNIDLTTAGDELSLDLGNLPADYDLVLYGPATSSLSGTPSGDTAEVTETPPPDQSTLGQQTDPDEGTLPLLPNRAIEAISATSGLGDQQITTPPLGIGTYTVEVSGYNGAYSTAQPYVLRDEVTPTSPTPSCSVPPTYIDDTPTLGETLPPVTSYPAEREHVVPGRPRPSARGLRRRRSGRADAGRARHHERTAEHHIQARQRHDRGGRSGRGLGPDGEGLRGMGRQSLLGVRSQHGRVRHQPDRPQHRGGQSHRAQHRHRGRRRLRSPWRASPTRPRRTTRAATARPSSPASTTSSPPPSVRATS